MGWMGRCDQGNGVDTGGALQVLFPQRGTNRYAAIVSKALNSLKLFLF
jgi:hypothetical protein